MGSSKTRLEKTEDGDWAVVEVDHDVQVGWCRHTEEGWVIEDSLDKAGAHADALTRH